MLTPGRSGFARHGEAPKFDGVVGRDVEPEWGRRNGGGPEFNLQLEGPIVIADFDLVVLGLDFDFVPSAHGDRGSLHRRDGLRSIDEAAHTNGAGIEKDAPVVCGVYIAENESKAISVSGGQSKFCREFGRGPWRGVETSEGFPARPGPQTFA